MSLVEAAPGQSTPEEYVDVCAEALLQTRLTSLQSCLRNVVRDVWQGRECCKVSMRALTARMQHRWPAVVAQLPHNAADTARNVPEML